MSESSGGINTDSAVEISGFGGRQNFESMMCNGRTQEGVGGPITLVVMDRLLWGDSGGESGGEG